MLWRSPLQQMVLWSGALRLLAEVAAAASPLCLHQLLRFLADGDTLLRSAGSHTSAEGALFAAALFLASVCHSLALQHYIAWCFSSAAHARALVQYRVFSAALALPIPTLHAMTHAKVTNLVIKDAGKIQDFLLFAHNIWSAPLSALWVCIGLFLVLGWAAAPGMLCTVIIIPLESRLARYAARLRRETMAHADARQKSLGAFFAGARAVKLAAGEAEVRAAVDQARRAELARVRAAAVALAANRAVMAAAPVVVALCSLALYASGGQPLRPDVAFTALALFNLLGHPLTVLPKTVSLLAELQVTLARLDALFLAPPMPPPPPAPQALPPPQDGAGAVVLRCSGLQGGWEGWGGPGRGSGGKARPAGAAVFSAVDLEVRRGQLVVVAGGVGSGKSTLLAVAVREACVCAGVVEVAAKGVGYAPQVPWIKNGCAFEKPAMLDVFCASIHPCVCVCVCVCVYIHIHVHMYACVYIHTYVYIYIYI